LAGAAVKAGVGCTTIERQRVTLAARLDVRRDANQSSAVGVDDQRRVLDDQNVTAT